MDETWIREFSYTCTEEEIYLCLKRSGQRKAGPVRVGVQTGILLLLTIYCLIGFFALCHNRNADGLAVSVRQTAYAANHLVGIFRVNAEVDCQINRFVKFRACIGLNQRNRFLQRVALVLVYVLIGVY